MSSNTGGKREGKERDRKERETEKGKRKGGAPSDGDERGARDFTPLDEILDCVVQNALKRGVTSQCIMVGHQ